MILSLLKFVFAAVVLFSLAQSTIAQTREAKEIRIFSRWGGLGEPAHDQLIITRKSDGYELDGKKVETRLVANLLDALNAPATSSIELSNLGISQKWLEANAEKGVIEYSQPFPTAAPNLQALYFSTFTDMGFMRRLVPSLYPGMWTDDFPLVEVEVTTSDGKKIVATSEAKQLFMLPWEVSKGRRKLKTYNADISRAVVALMPKEFVNRDRLSGEHMHIRLAEQVMWEIRNKWNSLDAENKTGKHFRVLKQKFLIETAEVNSYHNVDFGQEWVNGDPGVQNLQAKLTRRGLPRNFRIGIVLPFTNGEVEGVDTFLNGIDRYVKLALSVPWLSKVMRSHRGATVELRFVGDRSFSKKAMQIFAADMKLKGKEALVKEVAAVQENVSLLSVGWMYSRDYWLVLPDKRVVIWRFDSNSELIVGKSSSSSAWECSDYGDRCIGAIISKSGRVIGR